MAHEQLWNDLRRDRRHLDETLANEASERRKQEDKDKHRVEPNVRPFKYRSEYPKLPRPYKWKIQKNAYCPEGLLNKCQRKSLGRTLKETLNHQYGYVFCHRGLYDRGRDIIDNSATAIRNGVNQEMYLHEIDSFVLSNVNDAIIAHDRNASRVTTGRKDWEEMNVTRILNTQLVSKPVNTDTKDFAVQHKKTIDRVPGLMSVIWKNFLRPTGVTLQVDFRDGDFAKVLAYYSYHIATTNSSHEGLEHNLFQATMFKGYNYLYPSFSALETAIEEESITHWNENHFGTSHLHHLPPLIMVFSAEPLDKLARANFPGGLNPTYEQLYSTILEQVESFVRIGKHKYNFILEIGHSGLGLGYNLDTHQAKNPLDGRLIENEGVKYQSLLDRAMIDVSLYLRKRYPELLFASCTRLPDAILPGDEKCKVRYATAKIQGWGTGEETIASELRAIHGGLYPQSNIAIADGAVAEIAARTWIDQKAKLKREELFNIPYKTWLKKGGDELVRAMEDINGDALNRVGDLLDQSERAKPHDTNTDFVLCLDDEEDVFADHERWTADPRDLRDVDLFSEHATVDGRDRGDTFNPRVGMFDPSGYLTILRSGPNDDTNILSTKEGDYIFDGLPTALSKSNTMRLYDRVIEVGLEELKNLLKYGADINALAGPYGTPLAAVCGSARPSYRKIKLLLEHGAAVGIEGPFGYPLQLLAKKGDEKGVDLLLHHTRSQFVHQHHYPDKTGITNSMYAAVHDGSTNETVRPRIGTAYREMTGSNILVGDNVSYLPGSFQAPQNPTQDLFSRARQDPWRFGEGSPASRIKSCGHVDRVNLCNHSNHGIQNCKCTHTDCALCLTSRRTTRRDSDPTNPADSGHRAPEAPQQNQNMIALPSRSPYVSSESGYLKTDSEPQGGVLEAPTLTSTSSSQKAMPSRKTIPAGLTKSQATQEWGDRCARKGRVEPSVSRAVTRQSPQVQQKPEPKDRSKHPKQRKRGQSSTNSQHQPNVPLLDTHQSNPQEYNNTYMQPQPTAPLESSHHHATQQLTDTHLSPRKHPIRSQEYNNTYLQSQQTVPLPYSQQYIAQQPKDLEGQDDIRMRHKQRIQPLHTTQTEILGSRQDQYYQHQSKQRLNSRRENKIQQPRDTEGPFSAYPHQDQASLPVRTRQQVRADAPFDRHQPTGAAQGMYHQGYNVTNHRSDTNVHDFVEDHESSQPDYLDADAIHGSMAGDTGTTFPGPYRREGQGYGWAVGTQTMGHARQHGNGSNESQTGSYWT